MTFEEFNKHHQKVPVEEYPNTTVAAIPEPMVSCQVSTYRHAPYIRECLDGILQQRTNFPFEVLIGEDESNDGTREICIEYAERYPDRIRLFLHKRENNIAIKGRPTSKFQGMYTRYLCRGKYYTVLEGDDYWTDPDKLQKQFDFLESNPGYSGCSTDYSMVDIDGKVMIEGVRSRGEPDQYDRVSILRKGLPMTCTVMYRGMPSVYEQMPEFLEALNGDQVLGALMAQHGPIKFLNIITAVRRMGSGTFSTLAKPVRYARELDTFLALKDYLTKPDEQEALVSRIDVLHLKMMVAHLVAGRVIQAWEPLVQRKKAIGSARRSAVVWLANYVGGAVSTKLRRRIKSRARKNGGAGSDTTGSP